MNALELTADARLKINDDEIAAEIIDAEAVLINLGTGMYYTLEGTGCEVWAMVERRLTLADIRDALVRRYGVERERVLSDLTRLAGELLDEGLVRLAADADDVEAASDSAAERSPNAAPYAPPTLRRYTDMAEVLALDPPLPILKEDA